MKPFGVLLLSILLLSCEESPLENGPFTIGQSVDFYFDVPRLDVEGEYEVVFDVLEQDSRCPSNYECVWEGIGIIGMTITHGEVVSEMTLSTFDWENYTKTVSAEGLKFTLIELKPYPKGDELAASKNYVAKVLVESADQ
jgi:hypothetical protein